MIKDNNIQKNKGINIIKFVCAIIIACIYHYKNDFPTGDLFNKNIIIKYISDYGFLLVELFFMISGYLFYVSSYKKIKNKKIELKSYIINKYTKLFPLVILTSLTMLILQQIYIKFMGHYWIFEDNSIVSFVLQISGIQYWANVSTASLNNVTWYVSVLMLCYVLYYLLTIASKKYGNIVYVGFIILITTFMICGTNLPFINYYTNRGLLAFGIGLIIALIIDKNGIKKLFKYANIFLILVIVMTVIFKKNLIGDILLYLDYIIYPCILISIIGFEFIFNKVSLEFTEFLSRISFSIYLWNLPLQLLFVIIFKVANIKIDYSSPYVFIIQIVLHILFGIFSSYVIEKKISKIKIKFM